MCGICGLYSPSRDPEAPLVDEMRARIRHRGPDQGSTDALGACVLGHQRLQVLDPELGYQPVSNETSDVTAVFNGELYNFDELRAGLTGHTVRGRGDTPVIPHLYEEHGLEFVELLDGMFAVALWDAPRGRLVLARDRLGKKPLVHTTLADGTLAFASELKAFHALPGFRAEPDLPALDAYLALGYVPGTRTGLRGVERLEPGSLLVVENGSARVERYWRPEPQPAAVAADEEWLERVRDGVTAAVRKRLASDVPLGALLSGGVDSAIVVALMAAASSEPVRTFTVGFSDTAYDERAYARSVAERYGTRHVEVVLEPDAAATLPRLAAAFDEPLGDDAALPLFLICEAARAEVTVALVGDGGDESFAGYERYAAMGLADRIPGVAARAGAALVRALPSAGERRSPLARTRRFLDAAAVPRAERYGLLMQVLSLDERAGLWTDDARAEIGALASAGFLLGQAPGGGLAGLQALDARTYLPGDLLPKSDIASMAHSLELRSPLLDHRVVELGLALPEHLKLRGREGKVALRRAFAPELPDAVARRGKSGFGLPLASWFRGELRGLAHDVLLDDRARSRGWFRPDAAARLLREHEAGGSDNGHRLWALVMLELWQREHVDAQVAPAAA